MPPLATFIDLQFSAQNRLSRRCRHTAAIAYFRLAEVTTRRRFSPLMLAGADIFDIFSADYAMPRYATAFQLKAIAGFIDTIHFRRAPDTLRWPPFALMPPFSRFHWLPPRRHISYWPLLDFFMAAITSFPPLWLPPR
jgi:hypothetical protein